MKLSKFVAAIAMITAITGCAKNPPSEIEARAIVEKMVGNCGYFALDSFKRNDGAQKSEKTYEVMVSYTVKRIPQMEDVSSATALLDQYAIIDAKLEEDRAAYAKLDAEMHHLDEIWHERASRERFFNEDQFGGRRGQAWKESRVFLSSIKELESQKELLYRPFIEGAYDRLYKACLGSVDGRIFWKLYQGHNVGGPTPIETFTTEKILPRDQTLHFNLTSEGWKLDEAKSQIEPSHL